MGIFSAQDPSNSGSLFRTQADVGFNSFQNPMSTINMGNQGWGVSRDQMTPSYSAPFRPQGQEGPINSPRPGFFASANNQFNPLASNGYGRFTDPFWGQQQYRESIYGRPQDAAMWTAQNVGVGAGSFIAANAMTPGWAMKGANIGSRAGIGFGNGVMGGFASGTNMGMMARGGMGLAGAAGGAIFGGIVAPMMIAQSMVSAADYAVFDPYTLKRQTGRDLRENFSGTTFGGGEQGNPYSGRGMSFASSGRIASQMTKSSFKEFGLSGQEMRGIADMASRAGLMDNVNPDQFAKQFSQISKQVAVIAAIAKDPSFKNNIEIIAKLKDAGMNIRGASSTLGQISGSASISGISLSKMMDLSTQGQFMYGANNLTPYLGRMDYAQSHASFASAKRNGLMSDALLARMGGVEGAAQSAMTANVNGTQTPFNRVMMANQYMFGQGNNGSIAQNLSAFGSRFAGSPTEAYGAMGLYGGAMSSAQLAERGPLALQDQLLKIAKSSNMLGKDGNITSGNAYSLLTGTMGLDHKGAEAYIMQMMGARSQKNVNNQIAGATSDYRSNMAAMMDNEGANIPAWMIGAKRSVQNFGRGIKSAGSDLTDIFMDPMARATDSLGLTVDELKYGKKMGGQVSLLEEPEKVPSSYSKMKGNNAIWKSGDLVGKGEVKFYDAMNALSAAGNQDASNFLAHAGGDKKLAKEHLSKLMDSNENIAGMVSSVGIDKIFDHAVGKSVEQVSLNTKSYRYGRSGMPIKSDKEDMVGDYLGAIKGLSSKELSDAKRYEKNRDPNDEEGLRAFRKLKGSGEDLETSALKSRGTETAYMLNDRLEAAAKAKNMSGDEYITQMHGGDRSAALRSFIKSEDKASRDSLTGSRRAEASGASTIEKFDALREGHDKTLNRINDLQSQGRISGGEYLSAINKLTGEKMFDAADMFGNSVEKFDKAVQAMNPKQYAETQKTIEAAKAERAKVNSQGKPPGT